MFYKKILDRFNLRSVIYIQILTMAEGSLIIL